MRMLTRWFLVGLCLVSAVALAGPVTTESQATKLALDAIHEYHLTTLRDECGVADISEHKTYFDVDIREVHSAECGGIPETQPRLFTVRVRKRDGRLTSDAYDGVTYRPVDHPLQEGKDSATGQSK
jgi:hypothetical protein